MTPRPNQRVSATAHRLLAVATRVTHAVEMLGRVEACADERSPGEKVATSTGTSPTEATALRRYEVRTELEDLRDHVNDLVHTADLFAARVEEVIAWAHGRLGTTPTALVEVKVCDGKARGFDGHQLPWVRQSRDPRNGWHDPTCREIADETGLCPTCRRRMNRWRTEQGMPPVGVIPARGAA